MTAERLGRKQIAWRVAQDILDGAYVNLGIGMPEMVANYLPPEREVVFHSENGILGMGPQPPVDQEDDELINAGKKPVTLLPGAAFVHQADSFAIVRGGHLDICVLGAFQVSEKGDLANWSTGAADAVPGVGGAMDLVAGAKKVFVVTTHTDKGGTPKIVEKCAFPLTGARVVDTIYTDVAVIDVTPDGLSVRESLESLPRQDLQAMTGAQLIFPETWVPLRVPDLT